LLGGLWHGAGLAYVLWGFYQGLLLTVHRWWTECVRRPVCARQTPDSETQPNGSLRWPVLFRAVTAIKVILFFHVICVGWLLFRAGAVPTDSSQLGMVQGYLSAMFKLCPMTGISPLALGISFFGAWVFFFQWKHELMERFSEWPLYWQTAGAVASLAAIASLGVFEGAQFIYFQF